MDLMIIIGSITGLIAAGIYFLAKKWFDKNL